MAARKDSEHRRLVVPTKFRDNLLENAHNSKFSGHLGIKRTYYRLSSKYYWKGMHHDVVKWINSCDSCNMRKGDPSNLIGKYRVTQPWHQILLDLSQKLRIIISISYYLWTILQDILKQQPYQITLQK